VGGSCPPGGGTGPGGGRDDVVADPASPTIYRNEGDE